MDQLLDMEKLKSLSPDQRNQVITGLKQQAMIAQLQTLVTEASDKCLQKCITSPGTALTGGEKQCLQRCMERYIETWETVQRTLMQRLQSEMGSNSSSSMLGTDFNTTSFS